MTVRVRIPGPLRRFAGGLQHVEVAGRTVEEALSSLTRAHPDLRRHLFGEDGKLRNFVNIYVNREDVRTRERERTALRDGDTVMIVPSIAGGTGGTAPRGSAVSGKAAGQSAPGREGPRLSQEELYRYSRHIVLPEVGLAGQERLKAGSVLLIGAGGLGAPLGLYLAAAGVGRIGIVDFDAVDGTNLQRQVLYGVRDVGKQKAVRAAERLRDINPNVTVDVHNTTFTSANAMELVSGYDVVIDGTDNFPTRYLTNDACVLAGKPNVYGSIFRFEGQASVFWAEKGPCYRCLYANPPPPGLVPSCAEGGVLGVLPGIVGCIQANEAIKLLLGRPVEDTLVGRLLLFDALGMRFEELKLRKNPDCPICGPKPTIRELIDYEEFCGTGITEAEPRKSPYDVAPEELQALLASGEPVRLLDVREPGEAEICTLQGATLIPLQELPGRAAEVPKDGLVVAYCKMGGRSARATQFLRQQGWTNVKNLRGGIQAWWERIDPTMSRY